MKKGMINMIILALVLVNLVLSVMLVFTFVPSVNKTSKLVDKICKIVDLDVNGNGQSESEVAIEDLEYVQLLFADGTESQVFNLKQDNKGTVPHVKLAVTIAVNKKHADYKDKMSSLNASMTYISSKLGDIMTEYSAATANDNKRNMEKQVLSMLHELFNSGFIYDVSFPQFIISG